VSGEASRVQRRARKRLTLDAFPCPVGIGLTCNAECRDAIDRCEATICLWLPMYRQAVADNKCARVLLAIKRWWWDKHYWPDIFVGVRGDPGSMRIVRFRNWMNAALREAGHAP